jgi:hypothetical protein
MISRKLVPPSRVNAPARAIGAGSDVITLTGFTFHAGTLGAGAGGNNAGFAFVSSAVASTLFVFVFVFAFVFAASVPSRPSPFPRCFTLTTSSTSHRMRPSSILSRRHAAHFATSSSLAPRANLLHRVPFPSTTCAVAANAANTR